MLLCQLLDPDEKYSLDLIDFGPPMTFDLHFFLDLEPTLFLSTPFKIFNVEKGGKIA